MDDDFNLVSVLSREGRKKPDENLVGENVSNTLQIFMPFDLVMAFVATNLK